MNMFKLTSFFIFCVVFLLLLGTMQQIHSHHTPGDGNNPHPDISLSNSAQRQCGTGSAHVNVSLESVSLGKAGWTYDGKAWADSGGSNPKLGEGGNGVKLYCSLVESTSTYTLNGVKVTKKSVAIDDDKMMNLSDNDWWPDFCYQGEKEIAYASGHFKGHDSEDSGSCQAIYIPIFNRLGFAIGSAYCTGDTDVANVMIFRR